MKKSKPAKNVELIGYKFYGIPSDHDRQLELKTFGCCRKIWNLMLADKNQYYQANQKSLNVTPAKYKPQYPYLKEIDSLALANVQLHLDSAFSRFFDQLGKFPVFKSKKHARNSYTTNALYYINKSGVMSCNILIDETTGELWLPKHQDPIQLRLHRKMKQGGKLKSVTVSMEPDGKFYYSILMEYSKTVVSHTIQPENSIGLDMSLPDLYVDDQGNTPDFPKPYRNMEKRIAAVQKRLSRKEKGSANYEKERKKLASLYAKSKHQRNDFLHKLSCQLTDTYDIIGTEDLDMSAIKRSLHFGKSVSDNGWGMFTTMLQYKAEKKGKVLVKIDRWFPSSKTCCQCGHVHKELKLSDRIYVCPVCGNIMDRDHQAAKNIRQEAIRIWAESQTALS